MLVVSDFDGTLAPIVIDPMGARIEPGGRSALRRLARIAHARPDRLELAVLSGRAAIDVARRVRVGGIRYLGNHGLETGRLTRGDPAERLVVTQDPVVAIDADDHARAVGVAVAAALGRPAWLFVEPKGPSVAFHYRQAADPAAARAAVLDALDRVDAAIPQGSATLERLEGRQVVELRPSHAGGKGAAMQRLLDAIRPDAVMMLGDDVSDADAFRVVVAARDRREPSGAASGGAAGTGGAAAPGGAPPGLKALVIAVHGAAETPAEVLRAADVLVAAPRDAARALAELARFLTAETISDEPARAGRR